MIQPDRAYLDVFIAYHECHLNVIEMGLVCDQFQPSWAEMLESTFMENLFLFSYLQLQLY